MYTLAPKVGIVHVLGALGKAGVHAWWFQGPRVPGFIGAQAFRAVDCRAVAFQTLRLWGSSVSLCIVDFPWSPGLASPV